MKSLIFVLAFLPAIAFGKCDVDSTEESTAAMKEINTDVPAFLKGAMITVKLADGKETTVPAEKFKVVPRKYQYLVTKTHSMVVKYCESKGNSNKNRVSVMSGLGPNKDLSVNRGFGEVMVESKTGPVHGLQYQRKLDDKLSVGAQVQTNESLLLNVGFDF